jgi:hypothetical protein
LTMEAFFRHGGPPSGSSPLAVQANHRASRGSKKNIGGPLGELHCRSNAFLHPCFLYPIELPHSAGRCSWRTVRRSRESWDRGHFRDRKRPKAHNLTREALQKLTLTPNSPYPTFFLQQQTPVLKTFPIAQPHQSTAILMGFIMPPAVFRPGGAGPMARDLQNVL